MKFFALAALAATTSAVQISEVVQFDTTSGTVDATGTLTTAPAGRHDIWLHLSAYSEEVKFEIFGPTYCAGGPYEHWDSDNETNCSLVPGRYVLQCEDTYGDGWHGGYIVIGGTKYCEDFRSGSSKTVEFQIFQTPNKAGTQSGGGDQVAKTTGWNQSGPNN